MFSFSSPIRCFIAFLAVLAVLPTAFAQNWQWTTPTPGAVNIAAETGPVVQETQNGTPLTAMTLVISEVFAKGSDIKNEFVELYNYGKEPVDASGLVLENKAGKSYVLPAQSIIGAGSYMSFPGGLSVTDTGDTVLLKRGLEELDRLEFSAAIMKDGASAARYCEVYELRFCETQTSVPTPGAANMLEALKIWAEPADGVLRPGQKAQFMTNIPEARILLSTVPGSGRVDDAKLYTGPITVEKTATYWYYAQYQGQATVPQKVVFTVDTSAPSEEQIQNAKGLSINEIMIDAQTKKGWIEVYNAGPNIASLEVLRVDTRAKHEADCTSCLTFVGTQKVFPGAYALLEIPRATIGQLQSRQTPVQVRLVLGKEVLDTVEVPLLQQPSRWMSWMRLEGGLSMHATDVKEAWTDIPTPGVKNVYLRFQEDLVGVLTPDSLARVVYAQAAYEETNLLLRGKAMPGLRLAVLGNGESLAELLVPTSGEWEVSLPYEKTKNVTHLFFRLRSDAGVVSLLSAPFAVPAFDAEDPRQKTASTTMVKSAPVKKNTHSVTPAASPKTPTVSSNPYGALPLLNSMTGTVLRPVATGYAQPTILAAIEEREGDAFMRFLALLFGLSR